jgi:hypothetical protein
MMQVVAEAVTAPLTLFFSPPLSMQLIAKDDELNSNLRHSNIRSSQSLALLCKCLDLPLIVIVTCMFL